VCAWWCVDWGQAYRDAIVVAPDYALAYYNLGTTLMGEERYAEAEVATPPRAATLVAETGVAADPVALSPRAASARCCSGPSRTRAQ
jgi:hypothetical protein